MVAQVCVGVVLFNNVIVIKMGSPFFKGFVGTLRPALRFLGKVVTHKGVPLNGRFLEKK
jgi:hypothetical protein